MVKPRNLKSAIGAWSFIFPAMIFCSGCDKVNNELKAHFEFYPAFISPSQIEIEREPAGKSACVKFFFLKIAKDDIEKELVDSFDLAEGATTLVDSLLREITEGRLPSMEKKQVLDGIDVLVRVRKGKNQKEIHIFSPTKEEPHKKFLAEMLTPLQANTQNARIQKYLEELRRYFE